MTNRFREIVEAGIPWDDYEPQVICLVPVFLRTRRRYYQDAEVRVRQALDDIRGQPGPQYPSEEAFQQSAQVAYAWKRHSPYWWGLNDVVGWLEVRACVRSREFQISLFTTVKRASRTLRDKQFVNRTSKAVAIPLSGSNAKLRQEIIAALRELASHPLLRRRHVPLSRTERLIGHMDLIAIVREFLVEDAGTDGKHVD